MVSIKSPATANLTDGVLQPGRLTRIENFGHSISSVAFLQRPNRAEQIAELLEFARQHEYTIGLRGAGRSYGDASLNSGGILVDLQRMNRILDWDPETGLIRVEPGVTIQQVWEYTLESGWWLPVVPGTMRPTIGGCAAMNIHGKNNYQAGPIGEHIRAFTAILPNGEEIHCTPEADPELFFAMIGSLGVLGVFTSITIQLKRIYSGEMWVEAWAVPNLQRMLEDIETLKEEADYLVGWVDSTAGGTSLGRGQIHRADYRDPGEDPQPFATLNLDNQVLPDTILGIVPKSITGNLMRPFMNPNSLKLINTARYLATRTINHRKRYRQSFVAFNFLLDYVNWEPAYRPGGLIQLQIFIPKVNAQGVFTEVLRLTQKNRQPSYLGVLKRHRPDRFLLSHAVDGYSLALDFRLTRENKAKIVDQTREMAQIAIEAGGRFYFAKDSTLFPEMVRSFLGPDTITRFQELKERCDPDSLLETDLYRRCFRGPDDGGNHQNE